MSKTGSGIGKIMNSIMLSCNEATLLITRSEFEKLCNIKRLKLRMHLMSCKLCRNFQKQSSFITAQLEGMKKEFDAGSLKLALDDQKKSRLEELIRKELNKAVKD